MQQRISGFNMDVQQSLDVIRQNSTTLDILLNSLAPVQEVSADTSNNSLQNLNIAYMNPFSFSHRRLQPGQWIDVKDTIDQWVSGKHYYLLFS